MQRLFVHRAPMHLVRILAVDPAQGIQRPFVSPRILLQTLLQQSNNRALAATDRTVQQQHPLLDSVFIGSALQRVDKLVQRTAEAVDRVPAVVVGIVEEAVAVVLLTPLLFDFYAVRKDHVVQTLVGRTRDLGMLSNDVEILLETSDPILTTKLVSVLLCCDEGNDVTGA